MVSLQSKIKSTELYDDAKKAMLRDDLPAAIQAFESSVKCFPHFKSLELLGECYQKSNRYSEAIVVLAASTTLNKGLRAPKLLAHILYGLNEFQAAKDIALVILQRDPQHAEARSVLAKGNVALCQQE